jgi:geranylgeranyl diphosphate synthase type II
MTTTGEDLQAWLGRRTGEVEAALDAFLPRPPACPPALAAAMRYSLFAGGKRLRPALALASAEAVAATSRPGEEGDEAEAIRLALPAACALEMIHTYSLIHDDLPSMDNDMLRRGRPTLHVVHGEAVAILAGDGLLTEAFALLAREPADDSSGVRQGKLRTISAIATAAGVAGMVGGQVLDLEGLDRPGAAQAGPAVRAGLQPRPVPGEDAILRLCALHAAKTGALIRAAAVSGAIMAGGEDALITAIDRYAAALGLAFQITDDVLDVEGTAEQIGKTAGKDAALGKLTYPALYGVGESRRLAAAAIDAALAALADHDLGSSRLADIARWMASRRH